MALATLLALVVLFATCAGRARAAVPAPPLKPVAAHAAIPVSVSVDASEPGPVVPQNFLGLSFEVGSLRQLASYATKGDLVTMLRSLGVGMLRFGGVTADEQVAWTDAVTARPPWALSTLEGASLSQLGKLASASGWV